MELIYKFKKSDYNTNGQDSNGNLFSNLIKSWEEDYHNRLQPIYANSLVANGNTMILLKSCYHVDNKTDFGMDGDMTFEENMKTEEYSERETIYAISSQLSGQEDNPIFLTSDNNMTDGIVILKHFRDDEDEDDDELPIDIDCLFQDKDKVEIKWME